MPKKPPRNNPPVPAFRTPRSAAAVLARMMPRSAPGFSSADQVLEAVRAGLPDGLREHVLRAVEKGDELVILVDSAAWAARLRLALAGRPELAGGRRTVVKVTPPGATAA